MDPRQHSGKLIEKMAGNVPVTLTANNRQATLPEYQQGLRTTSARAGHRGLPFFMAGNPVAGQGETVGKKTGLPLVGKLCKIKNFGEWAFSVYCSVIWQYKEKIIEQITEGKKWAFFRKFFISRKAAFP